MLHVHTYERPRPFPKTMTMLTLADVFMDGAIPHKEKRGDLAAVAQSEKNSMRECLSAVSASARIFGFSRCEGVSIEML